MSAGASTRLCGKARKIAVIAVIALLLKSLIPQSGRESLIVSNQLAQTRKRSFRHMDTSLLYGIPLLRRSRLITAMTRDDGDVADFFSLKEVRHIGRRRRGARMHRDT